MATCRAHANVKGVRPDASQWGVPSFDKVAILTLIAGRGARACAHLQNVNEQTTLALNSSSLCAPPQTHTNTQRCGQQSGCWFLPVGLCSLNCLSDSRLSTFTTRDPVPCLPKPLATQRAHREEPVRAHEPNPNADGLTARQ